jgi:oligogalacturonide lyase
MPCFIAIFLFCTSVVPLHAADEPLSEWLDPSTAHKIIRLSRDPGSSSLYFHQNAYSADGQKLIITTPAGLSTINLQTREIEQIVEGRVFVIVTGRKSNQIYHTRTGTIYATDLNTKATREIAKLPGRMAVSTLNADETLLAGATYVSDPSPDLPKPAPRTILPQRQRMFPNKETLTKEEESSAAKEDSLSRRLSNPSCMALFTINTQTGEIKTFGHSFAWLNHLQFSPTDPTLLM